MAKKRRQHDQEEHIDETWLIPYSDLLTLLLALFIVLFASSSVDAQRFNEMMSSFNSVLSGGHGIIEPTSILPIGPDAGKDMQSTSRKNRSSGDSEASELQRKIEEETRQLEDLKGKIDQYFKDNGLDSQLTSELNNFQLSIRISDNALFTPGSAQVRPEARKLALAISDLLVEYPQYQVVVSGHTDTTPINNAQFRDNWDLSAARSLNFMKIILENKHLDPSRFSSVGYGEYQPIQPNTTVEGKAANRRVEVSIIRTIIEPPSEEVDVTPSE